jgi:hypothetical protein
MSDTIEVGFVNFAAFHLSSIAIVLFSARFWCVTGAVRLEPK